MQNFVWICLPRLCSHLTDSINISSVWKPYRKYVGNTVVNRWHRMPMPEKSIARRCVSWKRMTACLWMNTGSLSDAMPNIHRKDWIMRRHGLSCLHAALVTSDDVSRKVDWHTQKERARILFREFPDIQDCLFSHSFFKKDFLGHLQNRVFT